MLTMRAIVVAAAVTFLTAMPGLGIFEAQAQRVRLDASGNEVISLTGLTTDECAKGSDVEGTVVQRRFDEEGLTPVSFVLEEASGERSVIIVDAEHLKNPALSRFDRAWILNGLQKILRVGRVVRVGVRLCGAAGRVVLAESLEPIGR